MTISTPVHTGARSIDRVLAAGLPVLLVFWQRDCPTCHQLDSTLDALAEAYAGYALIARVDIQTDKALVDRYGVTMLPELVFLRDGRVVAKSAGAASQATLRAWLNYLIQGGTQPPLPDGPTTAINPTRASQPRQPSTATEREAITTPITVTDSTFERIVLKSSIPVLVDFWAPWCGPCRMVGPVVDQIAREFAGRALVAKLNTDENRATAQRYGIVSIPSLSIFHHGRVVQQFVGLQSASLLRQALSHYMAERG